MSFDTNQKDFETALKNLEDVLVNISDEISASDYDIIETVITEYNGHYNSDIQEMKDNIGNAEYSLEQSKLEVDELQSQISDMETTIHQLENEVENLNTTD